MKKAAIILGTIIVVTGLLSSFFGENSPNSKEQRNSDISTRKIEYTSEVDHEYGNLKIVYNVNLKHKEIPSSDEFRSLFTELTGNPPKHENNFVNVFVDNDYGSPITIATLIRRSEHTDVEVNVINYNFPKSLCKEKPYIWSPALAMCLAEENDEYYAQTKKAGEQYLQEVNPEDQALYERDMPGAKTKDRLPNLEMAANNGHLEALRTLANEYRKYSSLGDPDPEKSDYWYGKLRPILEKRHEEGNLESTLELAELYQFGYSVKQDNKKYLDLVRYAANKGSHEAIFSLAMAYKLGEYGVRQDKEKALELYLKAKELGNKLADIHIKELTSPAGS